MDSRDATTQQLLTIIRKLHYELFITLHELNTTKAKLTISEARINKLRNNLSKIVEENGLIVSSASLSDQDASSPLQHVRSHYQNSYTAN